MVLTTRSVQKITKKLKLQSVPKTTGDHRSLLKQDAAASEYPQCFLNIDRKEEKKKVETRGDKC